MSKKEAVNKKSIDFKSTKKRQISDAKTKTDKYKLWLIFILASTFIIYSSAIKNGFVNFDDERYILQNEAIKDISAQNIKTWFTTYFDGHYHPLSQLSLAIDFKFSSLSLPANFKIHELKAHYERGGLGDGTVKKYLLEVLLEFLEPIQQRRAQFGGDTDAVMDILRKGTERANETASQTLQEVRAAIGINYFEPASLSPHEVSKNS